MRRALGTLLLAAIVVGLAWAISLLHGQFTFEFAGISVATTTPVALLVLRRIACPSINRDTETSPGIL